jgi:hypothetical protein
MCQVKFVSLGVLRCSRIEVGSLSRAFAAQTTGRGCFRLPISLTGERIFPVGSNAFNNKSADFNIVGSPSAQNMVPADLNENITQTKLLMSGLASSKFPDHLPCFANITGSLSGYFNYGWIYFHRGAGTVGPAHLYNISEAAASTHPRRDCSFQTRRFTCKPWNADTITLEISRSECIVVFPARHEAPTSRESEQIGLDVLKAMRFIALSPGSWSGKKTGLLPNGLEMGLFDLGRTHISEDQRRIWQPV